MKMNQLKKYILLKYTQMTEFQIYSEKFYEQLDEIIDKVTEENTDIPYLSLEEYSKQQKIVEDFLKRNHLKIYGGIALDKFMPDNDKIYPNKKGKLIDYDAYSPTPRKHAVELGNELFQAGFKYVSVREGVNAGVYKVFNYFQEAADIVYIPEKIYNIIPYKTIDGLNYVSPKYLKIDLLVALTNPVHAIFRWDKDFERLQKLEKYFPPEKPKQFCEKTQGKYYKSTLNDIIDKFFTDRDDYILLGDMAYYAYMNTSGLSDYYQPEVKYLEIGMNNPSLIFPELRKVTNNKIKIKKYHPFLKHIPTRYIITPNDKENHIILIIYELNEKCIPYIEYNGAKVISYHGLVLYYNFMIYLSSIYGIRDRVLISECCLYDLERGKNYYFKRTGQNEFSDSIFKGFIIPCVGNEKNIYRESKIRGWNKGKIFSYVPSKREHLVLAEKVPPGIVRFVSGEFDKEIS